MKIDERDDNSGEHSGGVSGEASGETSGEASGSTKPWDNVWLLSIAAVLMWIVYLAVAYQPGGAPFIYAEF